MDPPGVKGALGLGHNKNCELLLRENVSTGMHLNPHRILSVTKSCKVILIQELNYILKAKIAPKTVFFFFFFIIAGNVHSRNKTACGVDGGQFSISKKAL